MKRCVVALLLGITISLGGIAVALAPNGESAGQRADPAATPGTPRASADAAAALAGNAASGAVGARRDPADQGVPDDTRRDKKAKRGGPAKDSRFADTEPAGTGADRRGPKSWTDAPPADPVWCSKGARSVVVDRAWQRVWLCDGGAIVAVIPVTSARSQPDPGAYQVYAKDWDTFSDYGPRRSTLDRFVAFAIGEDEGARVGFHAIPRYEDDGALAQPPGSLGTLGRFGDSSGCIRLLPQHADLMWNFLQIDDSVVVIS